MNVRATLVGQFGSVREILQTVPDALGDEPTDVLDKNAAAAANKPATPVTPAAPARPAASRPAPTAPTQAAPPAQTTPTTATQNGR
ncbi:hypothetical protein [Fodinicola feengrottensis]|nr:hypothetical protein [Fodinicola feengrottensis]